MSDSRFIAGRRYEVILDDCCIDAHFTARFIGYNNNKDYLFDNGVVVESIGASDVYEVFDEGELAEILDETEPEIGTTLQALAAR